MAKPSCEGCGVCCLNCGPGVMNDAGILSDPPVPCEWLDLRAMRCKDFDRRPQVCLDYLPGDEACMVARARHGIDPQPPCLGHDLADYSCSLSCRPQACRDWLATRLAAELGSEACREVRARHEVSVQPVSP